MGRSRDREALEERHAELEFKGEEVAVRRKSETIEEREVRLRLRRERMARVRNNETAEEREVRLRVERERAAKRSHSETAEEREVRLRLRRERVAKLRSRETAEEREVRLRLNRERMARVRNNETAEERKVRLRLRRERMARVRNNETAEEREVRLRVQRESSAKRRNTFSIFEETINSFCTEFCEVCTRRLYPQQVYSVCCGKSALTYLPSELRGKDKLRVCYGCRSHLEKNKSFPPARAYWNSMDPGVIPMEISSLSQAEQRLLSRIIPFVKIVKLSGAFGQYGLKGQAVMFAQDIFEITDKLPDLLPRPIDTAGLVIVTECLEDLGIRREFRVSKDRMMAALTWLVGNNPLYRDVRINTGAEEGFEGLLRLAKTNINGPVTEKCEEEIDNIGVNAFKAVNSSSRIVRASWHQGDSSVFVSGYAGVQCLAMALANILRAKILSPCNWTTGILNQNMIEGDALYGRIRTLLGEEAPVDGHLEVGHLDVVKSGIHVFGEWFSIGFDRDTMLFGNLRDAANKGNIGFCLASALEQLFVEHSAGVLIAARKSLGVMHHDGKYYFTDSHSCGVKGAPSGSGRGCVIECDSLRELVRIIRRCVGSGNTQFTVNHIDVNHTSTGNIGVREEDIGTVEESRKKEEERNALVIQTTAMVPVDCMQPTVEDEYRVSENVHEIRRKTKGNIVNESTEIRLEELAWFYLFPYGVNGLKQERMVRISPLDYYQARILGRDTRFQRNDYLFYALSMFEYYKVQSTISACCRKVEGTDGKVEDIHLYMRNLRGSASYWVTALNDLVAQIRCLGPPSYFVTFSCNDLHWSDMRKALLIADERSDQDPELLSVYETQELIEKYPVIVSRHFMVRVNALMRFMKANETIFHGELMDFWWRVEFQKRGSPHLHMVVWIAGHPSLDTQEGLDHVDRVCTSEMPQEGTELFELVTKCQVHRHTHTCRRQDSDNVACRFNFPRQVCQETHLLDASSDEFIRNGGRICLIRRRKEDAWVNNYNPILLKLWIGNMDIQPCGSNESIAFYVAKYISKSEPTEIDSGIRDAIRQIRREETDVSRKLFRICMRIMKERQVSASECVFRLCHLNMRMSSRKVVFLNTRRPELRYKVIRFDEEGKANGYYSNMFERYEKRPLDDEQFDFGNMCLVEFCMLFEPYYAVRRDADEQGIDEDVYDDRKHFRRKVISLIDGSKILVRNNSACVRVPYFVAARDPSGFYYSLLVQYKPFRRESELLAGFDSPRDAFLAHEESLKKMSAYMEKFRLRDRQLENAFNQVHAFQLLEDLTPPQIDDEVSEMNYRPLDEDSFERAKRSMNTGQRDVFNTVTSGIQSQLAGEADRLRLFVTGGAGVGKTFLLNLLRNQINRCYGRVSVVVCALTGVAARLIEGATIHATLKLPVQKDGRFTNMSPLTGNYLRVMRQQWRDVQFLILDEISMISYEMFCLIDLRLRQLKNQEDELFGGINVLLFGDLMQLPPIKTSGAPIYKQPERLQPATHLWRLFKLCELDENMRQQGDNTFVNLLNALRVGEMNAGHFKVLMDHVLTEATGNFAIDKALRIYPTNQQVEEHNRAVLEHFRALNLEIVKIKAVDQVIDASRIRDNTRVEDIVPGDVNKTGGLPSELELFVGAKVMLRSNVDVSKGLVNGAIGFVVEIIWPHFRRGQIYETDIPSVRVDFGDTGIHVVSPKVVQFPAKGNKGVVERRMLPLVLCWASTVHKMQGCTVDYAVVYLGSKLFEAGQGYVALSRVRSLEGLRVEDLDCWKLSGRKPCNEEALVELERMRTGSIKTK